MRMEGNILAVRDINKSPWIKLQRIYYTNDTTDYNPVDYNFNMVETSETGHPKLPHNVFYWDAFVRSHSTNSIQCDSVIIFPIAYCQNYLTQGNIYLILVEQFRPSQYKNVLEFPSGLVDHGEEAENTALRELKEETGYTGKIINGTHVSSLSVLCSETGTLSLALINLNDEINSSPKQALDETERIVVHKVEIGNFVKFVKEFAKKPNCRVSNTISSILMLISFMSTEDVYKLFRNIIIKGNVL